MEDVETKKKHRRVLRAGFTKSANELDSLLKVNVPVLSDIEVSWECLKPKYDGLRIYDNEIFEGLLENATEELLISEVESCDAYIKRFTELRLRCSRAIDPKPADDVTSKILNRSRATGNSRVSTSNEVRAELYQLDVLGTQDPIKKKPKVEKALPAKECGTSVSNKMSNIPANLPFQGCKRKQLLKCKWWEEPNWSWLYHDKENCPFNKGNVVEDEGAHERKKKLVSTLVSDNCIVWHLSYFCKFTKTVKMIAWNFRSKCHLKNTDERRAVRSVSSTCVPCRRLDSKPFAVEPSPLPEDKVCDAVAFKITYMEFAGPLDVKCDDKAWTLCLFTCAVYRAIHMELKLSLSIDNLSQVLRRFVAKHGEPNVVYGENGTNFGATDNALVELDCQHIMRGTKFTQLIIWHFNPPSVSWWGGFFDRLIGVVKINLLCRIFGRAGVRDSALQEDRIIKVIKFPEKDGGFYAVSSPANVQLKRKVPEQQQGFGCEDCSAGVIKSRVLVPKVITRSGRESKLPKRYPVDYLVKYTM